MSAILAVRPDGSGLPFAANQRHAYGVQAALNVCSQLDRAGLDGTTGAERAAALTAFAGRDRVTKDSAPAIRKARWATRDARRQAAIWLLANGHLSHSPSAVQDAVRLADRWCTGMANDGRVTDSAFNPNAGGAVFPGLIGQMLTETTPLAPMSFERIFSRVIPETLMPGMSSYRAIRRTPVGNPAVGSGIAESDVPIMRVGQEQEDRATAWLVLALEQSYVASLQASLPGAPVVGMAELNTLARRSMAHGENRLNWYGDSAANFPGLLSDTSLIRSAIPSSEATLSDNTEQVINAIADHVATAINAGGGLMEPDLCVFSQTLIAKLVKPLGNTTGITATSAIEFLQDSQLARMFPGLRFEVAAELNDINPPNTSAASATATGIHGILLTRSDEMGVHRVPILPVTVLPIVEGGVIQTAYMVAQVGAPWVSGLGLNYLITIQSS